MTRLFAALSLPESVRIGLDAQVRCLAGLGDVRWTAVADFHVTLVFLGECAVEREAAIAAVVRAFRGPDPEVRLQQLGCFPERGEPRVLWAGLDGDLAALRHLQRELAESIGRELGCDLAAAERFSPHVTIGRVRSTRGLDELVDAMVRIGPSVCSESFRLGPVVLYASDRGSAVRYRELARATVT